MIRVLIVDDDKLARKGLISIMPWASHGMEVVGEAANGAKALEFLEENHVDLMFVDLAMPVISGIELMQEARRRYPSLQFVVLTFHEEFEHVQTTLRLGVLDYISKVRLDMEDYEQIFEHIQRRLESGPQQNPGPAAPVQNTEAGTSDCSLNEESWRSLERDWRALCWLYDETAFQSLCDRTVVENVSVRRVEGLFMRVMAQIDAITHLSPENLIELNTMRSAVGWIRNYRDSLYLLASKASDHAETSVCIMKAILFIRKQIATPLHAETAADHINMSRSYFSQCFKKLTGLTFNDYIRQERMRLAEQLLCQSNQTITWIANAVGYGDVKYFSHIFQEHTRLLPSEYRAQFLRGDK